MAGLNKNANLPVTHVSSGTLSAAIAAAIEGRRDHVAAIQNTRLNTRKQAELRESAIDHASVSKDVLVPHLGRKWDSTTWPSAGWSKGTLSVPKSVPGLVDLYTSLHGFLDANSGHESETLGVTAVKAKQFADDLDTCAQCVRDAKSEQRKKRTKRLAADRALMSQTRSLVGELKIILKADDDRWMDFLAQVPGDPRRPEPVVVVVARGGGSGALELDWERPARAKRFHVEVQLPGSNTFKRLQTVKDTNASLTGLPPGAQVKVRVVAVNEAGESAPSDSATVEVPALAKAA